ncbi:hypothetical protein F4680DRAFT_427158 [Xylaria scruposa]|nr:hypothetical protein F4680DRAFT_427158 [Xylaria scruposa]
MLGTLTASAMRCLARVLAESGPLPGDATNFTANVPIIVGNMYSPCDGGNKVARSCSYYTLKARAFASFVYPSSLPQNKNIPTLKHT